MADMQFSAVGAVPYTHTAPIGREALTHDIRWEVSNMPGLEGERHPHLRLHWPIVKHKPPI